MDATGARWLHLEGGKPFDETLTWSPHDERELSRRDLAHYQAFQVIGIAVMAILVVTVFGLRSAMGSAPRGVAADNAA